MINARCFIFFLICADPSILVQLNVKKIASTFNPRVLVEWHYVLHWIMDWLLMGWRADLSRLFIANPDWQFSYVKRTPGPIYVSASVIGVHFRGSLCVRSRSAAGSLCVRSGFALPKRTLTGHGKRTQGPVFRSIFFLLSNIHWLGTAV